MDANEAREALAQIADTKQQIADRSAAPKFYYAAIGLVQWLFILAITLPMPWSVPLIALGLAGLGATVAWYQRVSGTWAWGDIRGIGSWLFWVMVAITIVAVVCAMTWNTPVVGLIAGGVVFLTYAFVGPFWDRAYQRQLAGSA